MVRYLLNEKWWEYFGYTSIKIFYKTPLSQALSAIKAILTISSMEVERAIKGMSLMKAVGGNE